VRVRVIAPGKPTHPGAIAYIDDYGARIDRLVGYARTSVREGRRGKGASDARARVDESAALLAAVPHGAMIVALDAGGRRHDSESLLLWLAGIVDGGAREIAFLIGGPDGLDKAVLERAHASLSLSPMTLPHELAEVVLLEAVYRALMRWKGLPYHR
jgi:23S rRNA (pseudouridine1915-N3)-methyltransferase